MAVEGTPEVDFRVSLRHPQNVRQVCTFVATPDLIETRNVNYKTIEPIHAPGQIIAYATTTSRNFNISGIKLISRTQDEALQNLRKLWLLRSWTMPQFGRSTLSESNRESRETVNRIDRETGTQNGRLPNGEELSGWTGFERSTALKNIGTELRGQPPAVLLLSAYSKGSAVGRTAGHINRVPVVIHNISIPYPSDVDYIPTAVSGIPMPTIMMLDMTLIETHSPREYEKFSLTAFKNGTLAGF